jgi:hypothetical protein
VQSVPITTKVVSLNPVHGEVYSLQHYVIKFVSDLRQVGQWFFSGTPVSSTNKADRHDITKILLKLALSTNQRLPGACNRSPGSKLLSITMQLHCGGHLGGRARLPNTILEENHPMTIPSKFGSN